MPRFAMPKKENGSFLVEPLYATAEAYTRSNPSSAPLEAPEKYQAEMVQGALTHSGRFFASVYRTGRSMPQPCIAIFVNQ
jgi:hypothetical protein